MTTQELVERLRTFNIPACVEAADELPHLEKEVWRLRADVETLCTLLASRLSEMDAEIKRLREIESFAQTAARWSNPERRHPHTIVSADEMLKAIWGHPSRAALEHQQKEE